LPSPRGRQEWIEPGLVPWRKGRLAISISGSRGMPDSTPPTPRVEVAECWSLPFERRLGKRVTLPDKNVAYVTDEVLAQIVEPAKLNSGNVVDIFQKREEDFNEVKALEVSYQASNGQAVREIMYVDNLGLPTQQPRICVAVDHVHAMHRAISVLTRKVDNLSLTLKCCREHYYKELFSLRHGRDPLEEHEKYWFHPEAYEDNVTKQMIRERIGEGNERLVVQLKEKNAQIRALQTELSRMADEMERSIRAFVQDKTLQELFDTLLEGNSYRRVDFFKHVAEKSWELLKEDESSDEVRAKLHVNEPELEETKAGPLQEQESLAALHSSQLSNEVSEESMHAGVSLAAEQLKVLVHRPGSVAIPMAIPAENEEAHAKQHKQQDQGKSLTLDQELEKQIAAWKEEASALKKRCEKSEAEAAKTKKSLKKKTTSLAELEEKYENLKAKAIQRVLKATAANTAKEQGKDTEKKQGNSVSPTRRENQTRSQNPVPTGGSQRLNVQQDEKPEPGDEVQEALQNLEAFTQWRGARSPSTKSDAAKEEQKQSAKARVQEDSLQEEALPVVFGLMPPSPVPSMHSTDFVANGSNVDDEEVAQDSEEELPAATLSRRWSRTAQIEQDAESARQAMSMMEQFRAADFKPQMASAGTQTLLSHADAKWCLLEEDALSSFHLLQWCIGFLSSHEQSLLNVPAAQAAIEKRQKEFFNTSSRPSSAKKEGGYVPKTPKRMSALRSAIQSAQDGKKEHLQELEEQREMENRFLAEKKELRKQQGAMKRSIKAAGAFAFRVPKPGVTVRPQSGQNRLAAVVAEAVIGADNQQDEAQKMRECHSEASSDPPQPGRSGTDKSIGRQYVTRDLAATAIQSDGDENILAGIKKWEEDNSRPSSAGYHPPSVGIKKWEEDNSRPSSAGYHPPSVHHKVFETCKQPEAQVVSRTKGQALNTLEAVAKPSTSRPGSAVVSPKRRPRSGKAQHGSGSWCAEESRGGFTSRDLPTMMAGPQRQNQTENLGGCDSQMKGILTTSAAEASRRPLLRR